MERQARTRDTVLMAGGEGVKTTENTMSPLLGRYL
jgi:hypothetical protein